MRKLLVLLGFIGLAVTEISAPSAVSAAPPRVELPVCRDSNGAAPGGSVYLFYGQANNYCTVLGAQRLHLLRTPSRSACTAVGGNYLGTTCWDTNH